MPEPDLNAYFDAHWASIEGVARTLDLRPNSTILPSIGGKTGPVRVARSLLQEHDQVVLLDQTLGEGGMGIVRLGTQTSLDRTVAVKAVKKDRLNDATMAKLVQEAWVTGYLDHPNIVPVYDLARDEDGAPLLIMKRIEGVPWDDLHNDADAVRERFGAEDPLDWNLRVLMQVAHALHYAHSRGVLHLDLKPSNVMIGPFGEVYLVDWGLAMSLRPGEHRLPLAADNTEIIGTPSFLAPEMLTSEGRRLGVRTDVYLLGSMLHTLLAGAPPHTGDNVLAILFKVINGEREVPSDAPPELALVAERAMQIEPAARYLDAEEFRLAVQGFLQHRSSSQLAEQATECLAVLERLVEAGEEEGVQATASAARFGFGQAQVAWSGNTTAREGLQRSTALLAIWAARRGDLATAEGLAQEIGVPVPELEQALSEGRALAEAEAARVAGLQRLGDEHDPRTGQRTRLFVTSILLVLWSLMPLIGLLRGSEREWASLIGVPAVSLVLVAGLTLWARESMLATKVNRSAVGTIVLMLLAQLILAFSAWQRGLGPAETLALVSVIWAMAATTFAMNVERRTWPAALGYALTAVVYSFQEAVGLTAMFVANMVLLINVLVIWNPKASVAPKDVRAP